MIRVIFDCTILVNANTGTRLHRTGLFRVADEILKRISSDPRFGILLFDNLLREREINRYVHHHYPGTDILLVHSWWVRIFIFPFGNLADWFRILQANSQRVLVGALWKLLKNLAQIIYKTGRKIDKVLVHKSRMRRIPEKADVYYTSYFPVPFYIKDQDRIKKIYTLHDLIPLIHPEYFSSPFNEKLLGEVVEDITRNDLVFCVSESTRKDLLDYRPDLDQGRLVVTHNATSGSFAPVSDPDIIDNVKDHFNIPHKSKYLLSLCTLEPRKNLKTLVEAFQLILKAGNPHDLYLVLTGAPGWETDVLMQVIHDLNTTYDSRIILTGFVPDKDLSPLYSGAFAFVYPSKYEGFGLPVLEAMSCGIPVIASMASSIPEVCGKAGILVDPDQAHEIVDAINILISDPQAYEAYTRKSLNRSKVFDWETTAKQISDELVAFVSE